MADPKPALPQGHGELLVRPAYAEWPRAAEENARSAGEWSFEVGGVPARELREVARREACASAEAFSARLGVPVRRADSSGLLAVTGHQPELYHPGVWVKSFLVQRLSDDTGCTGIDLVVDSDGFDEVSAAFPCLQPEVRRCREVLATGAPDSCYACTAAPDAAAVEAFRAGGACSLGTLPTPAIARHFGTFCDALAAALPEARNLAEAVTFARRRFEAPVGTDLLELPVTAQAGGSAFLRFFADIALSASRFAQAYNTELALYRRVNAVRSSAQPFPDLSIDGETVETPFWSLSGGRRHTVRARVSDVVTVTAGGQVLAESAADPDALVEALAGAGAQLAPKALALTLFNRVFVADLFVHGVGGGRYDRVTDGVVRSYYGVEPPQFAVASLTMYLPLGGRLVTDAEVGAAEHRVNVLEHNPDRMVADLDFEDPEDGPKAQALAARKRELVSAIAEPAADKKALGAEIREVNGALARLLAPVAEAARAERDHLKAQRAASDVLTDRTYPFCLWSPQEVADKVR